MNKTEAKNRIKKLKDEINHYRYSYHVLNVSEISEEALDSLKKELFDLEKKYPEFITKDSPTQRVEGAILSKFEKVKHSNRMISLFDSFSRQDMLDWEIRMKRIVTNLSSDYFCELKLDGIAIALHYKYGQFDIGITRGDGKVGENVTNNVKTIESIPLALRIPTREELVAINFSKNDIKDIQNEIQNGKIEIRGEIIMPIKSFNDLNKKLIKKGESPMANPRNGVAGTIRQLNAQIVSERKLDFYAYELVSNFKLKTQEQKIQLLKLLGVKIVNKYSLCQDMEQVFEFREKWSKNRNKLDFEIDGVVVKINELKYWDILGIVGKGPRYMMAYKFPAEQVITKVKDVKWQIGRTGVLTPVAILEPVEVGGVVISRATLHNMDEIKRLDLKIGDTIIIERAGDVIPKIVKTFKKLRSGKEKIIKPPKKCPICHSDIYKNDKEVAYRCINKNCYAVNLSHLVYWASKGAMDIKNLGEKVVEQLVKNKLVSDISDFYKLKYGDLVSLERFAEKSAKNLIKAIQAKKNIDLAKFLYGLGIKFVGEENSIILSKLIVRELKLKNNVTISKIIKFFQNKTTEHLEKINDIGPVVAKSIIDWFTDKHNVEILKKMEKLGIKISVNSNLIDDIDSIFSGKKVVITGSFSNLTRAELKDKIRELGGNVSSAISSKIDYLLVGEKPGSKLEKAEKLNIKIIKEKEFFKYVK